MYFDHAYRAPSETIPLEEDVDRSLLQTRRKPNHHQTGDAGWPHDICNDALHHRREPADHGASGNAARRRPVCDVHLCRRHVGLSHPSQSPVHPRVVTAEEIEPVADKTLGTRSGGVVRQHLTHDLRAPLLTLTRASAILWLQPRGNPRLGRVTWTGAAGRLALPRRR